MAASDRRVREVFVELADTLVAVFDIIDYLDRLTARCVELLTVADCGVMLIDHYQSLNLVAASTERMRQAELAQIQTGEGPCLDALRTGHAVRCGDLTEDKPAWPRFAEAAMTAGYVSVQSLPMRLRDNTIGAVNLFGTSAGVLDDETVELGQALADAATIGILHQRSLARQETLTEQLQTALNSRVAIEQAKGYLSRRLGVDVEDAFAVLRRHARDHNRRLTEVAVDVVEGKLDPSAHRN